MPLPYVPSPVVPEHDPGIADLQRAAQLGQRSTFNGYKLMSPHVQDAIQQANQLFPANTHGVFNPDNQAERFVAFHDRGQDKLVPGQLNVGNQNSVTVTPDTESSTAKVSVHSHPFTPVSVYYHEPSMADQLFARRLPHAEHIVQTPALPGEENQYFSFTGATPPRYYRLLPNPDNLPVPPRSPDRAMPPFRTRPVSGEQEGISFSDFLDGE
jgi:hypothetical protein